MFLAAHPEIAHHVPRFAQQINHLPPLDAYKFFMKGYTKPARYIEGVSVACLGRPADVVAVSRP